MSLILRTILISITTLWCVLIATAETITISSDSTASEELPKLVAETVERLAKSPGQSHKLILQGDFKPLATLKIQWWGDHQLTLVGPALLDGSDMPKKSETIFMAGRNLSIEKLRFVNSQGHAVIVGGRSQGYAIRDCVFRDCQQSAIHVWNDPETIESDESRRGMISGNRITGFNLAKAKWSNDGITVFDQRVTLSRNHISNSLTEANGIRAMGRDLIIERNVVEQVSKNDAGGIYLWGGPHASLFRGNVVRWNHVVGTSRGIYLDDGTSGVRVEENLVEDSSTCAIFISGGRDNIVERNVIHRAPVFIHIDSRCLGWDSRPEYSGTAENSVRRLREALTKEPGAALLRERYAGLRGLDEESLKAEVYGRPEGNQVKGNFVRSVEKDWELMDFSAKVKTDFEVLNELSTPKLIGPNEDLQQVSFAAKFGFQGWDRLKGAGPDDSEGE